MTNEQRLVGAWMSTELLTTTPGSALGDALEVMERRRIRHLPVILKGRLVGLLSDRDARRCLNGSKEVREVSGEATPVREVMTPAGQLHEVHPTTLIRSAAEMICREKISSLPVVQAGGLVGLITSEDLLWAFLENHPEFPESPE